MGMDLGVTLGYGLLLLENGADWDEYNKTIFSFQSKLNKKPAYDNDPESVLEALISDYTYLSYSYGATESSVTGLAFLVNRLSTSDYWKTIWLDSEESLKPTLLEESELFDLAKRLEIPYKPRMIAIPSFW